MRKIKNRAETFVELLIAGAIAAILFASAIGAFIFLKNVRNYSIIESNLQRDVNVAINRMVRNIKEGGAIQGLRAGRSFTIPSINRINYIGSDGVTRSYYVSGNSIIYESPLQSPAQSAVFTAPAGSAITLRFWEPASYLGRETVGIYIGVTKQVLERTVSGSVSTYVNLRNVAK